MWTENVIDIIANFNVYQKQLSLINLRTLIVYRSTDTGRVNTNLTQLNLTYASQLALLWTSTFFN